MAILILQEYEEGLLTFKCFENLLNLRTYTIHMNVVSISFVAQHLHVRNY